MMINYLHMCEESSIYKEICNLDFYCFDYMDSIFPCLMIVLCMCVKKVERIFKDSNLRFLDSVLPPMISSQS